MKKAAITEIDRMLGTLRKATLLGRNRGICCIQFEISVPLQNTPSLAGSLFTNPVSFCSHVFTLHSVKLDVLNLIIDMGRFESLLNPTTPSQKSLSHA